MDSYHYIMIIYSCTITNCIYIFLLIRTAPDSLPWRRGTLRQVPPAAPPGRSTDLGGCCDRLCRLGPLGMTNSLPKENHRKTIGKWWFNGIEWMIYPLVMTNIAMV